MTSWLVLVGVGLGTSRLLDWIRLFLPPMPAKVKSTLAIVVAGGAASGLELSQGKVATATMLAVVLGAIGVAQLTHEVTAVAQAVKDRNRLQVMSVRKRP